jgi:hypothetical protein
LIFTPEYFNDISNDMISCAMNATIIKRNGFYKRALEIWKRYPKPGHPYQLIGMGKLHVLLDDIHSAKTKFYDALQIFCAYDEMIDDPLRSNILSCIEHFGYCLRENSDKKQYLSRISGSTTSSTIDWKESKERISTSLMYLNDNDVWSQGFEDVSVQDFV